MDVDQRSDEELARQVAEGDEAAFAEIYQRYFGRVYDFAIRMARDRDVAALVVQSSFLRLYQGLRAGAEQAPLKLQLFANARVDVAERLRRRREAVLEGDEAFVVADPALLADPALAVELPDLARMTWRACREMKVEEYELLDLRLRRELDEAEIAAVLRTRPEAVQTRLTRLRQTLEETFSALLLLDRGRQACLDLDFQIGDDEWSNALRRRILRHLQDCQICQATRRPHLSAAEVLAALTPVAAPAGWQETILDRLQNAARSGALAAEPAPVAPAAASSPPRRPTGPVPELSGAGGGIGDWVGRVFGGGGGARGPLLVVLGGGLLVAIAVLAALCGAGAFDGGEAEATPTTSPTLTATTTTTQTPTRTPTETATTTPPRLATATPVPSTATAEPATSTTEPATATVELPTATPELPTATPEPPTATTGAPATLEPSTPSPTP